MGNTQSEQNLWILFVNNLFVFSNSSWFLFSVNNSIGFKHPQSLTELNRQATGTTRLSDPYLCNRQMCYWSSSLLVGCVPRWNETFTTGRADLICTSWGIEIPHMWNHAPVKFNDTAPHHKLVAPCLCWSLLVATQNQTKTRALCCVHEARGRLW